MSLLKLHPTILAFVRQLPLGRALGPITERKLRALLGLEHAAQIEVARRIPGFEELLALRAGVLVVQRGRCTTLYRAPRGALARRAIDAQQEVSSKEPPGENETQTGR